jgi:hypothetical protein
MAVPCVACEIAVDYSALEQRDRSRDFRGILPNTQRFSSPKASFSTGLDGIAVPMQPVQKSLSVPLEAAFQWLLHPIKLAGPFQKMASNIWVHV